jgi:ribosomal protein S18 acetylase RimI-like enzyme
MDKGFESLIRINKDCAKPAVKVLSNAFRDFPLLQFYFPDNLIREKILNYFLSFVVYTGIKYGEVYTTSNNLEGIAVWLPSKNYPISFWKMLRSVPILKILGFGRHGGSKLRAFNDHIDNVHQKHTPFKHWFLQAIGITPRSQGKGYASRLLRPMLNRIDKKHLPCYLETISEKNVSIYEHFGFKTIDKSNIPETTLMNWAMLRKV